jgi:hypothetical protein
MLTAAVALSAQQPPGRPPSAAPPPSAARDARDVVTPAQLAAAIDKLGTVEFTDRMAAAKTARRADPAIAVPALLKAVDSHPDSFVRFRALVLLSGFNDPRTRDVMRASIGQPNDRLVGGLHLLRAQSRSDRRAEVARRRSH